MIINIIDGDMIKYHQTPFNIDLMKIAAYYKKRRDIVVMTPFIDLDKYSKIVYYKDYYDGEFDSTFLMNEKVAYGGRAFNRTVYKPLPEEIEKCLCDRYVYAPMEKIFCTNKKNTTLFNQMMRAQHLRLSSDGRNIHTDWTKQIDPNVRARTFIFHDYDLGKIDGAIDVIKDIYETIPGNQTKYMGMKFPVQLYNENDLMNWTQFHPMLLFYNLEYNGIMKDEALVDFCERQKGTSIAAQTAYNLTRGLTEEEVLRNLRTIYRQVVFLRTNRIQMRLKYDDTIFSDKRWGRILDLFTHYYYQALVMTKTEFNRVVPFDSLYSFAANLSEVETYRFHFKGIENKLLLKDEARELFQFVREKDYELFKDFYECHTVKLKGGVLDYD